MLDTAYLFLRVDASQDPPKIRLEVLSDRNPTREGGDVGWLLIHSATGSSFVAAIEQLKKELRATPSCNAWVLRILEAQGGHF